MGASVRAGREGMRRMPWPDTLLLVNVLWYLLLALAYGTELSWGKVLYFTGAAILTVGVLYMK